MSNSVAQVAPALPLGAVRTHMPQLEAFAASYNPFGAVRGHVPSEVALRTLDNPFCGFWTLGVGYSYNPFWAIRGHVPSEVALRTLDNPLCGFWALRVTQVPILLPQSSKSGSYWGVRDGHIFRVLVLLGVDLMCLKQVEKKG